MSADIEMIDGVAQIVYATEGGLPWHRQGVSIPQAEFTLARLAQERPAILSDQYLTPEHTWHPTDADGPRVPTPGHGFFRPTGQHQVKRGVDHKWLGTVGKRFAVIQPSEVVEQVMEAAAGEGCTLETAMNLGDGKRACFLIRDPNAGFKLRRPDGRVDETLSYTLVSIAYDGTGALQITRTNVRVVCSNTEAQALRTGDVLGKVRHTAGYQERLDMLVAGIREARVHATLSQEWAAFLDSQRIQKRELSGMLDVAIGIGDGLKGKARTRRENKRDEIVRLFSEGQGNLGETRWDAYNAVTEFETHQSTLHGISKDAELAAFQRQLNAMTSGQTPLRQQMAELLSA